MKTSTLIYRACFFTLSFATGMALNVACWYSDNPRAEHCQNNEGDAYCKQLYPDAQEHRWYCERSICWVEGNPKDGCVTEIPKKKDECYKPCGLMTAWDECNSSIQTTSMTETGMDTDTSTETTDTGNTTESGSETSETSGGGICGDGVQDEGEECDDGNEVNDDECTNFCTAAVCGDKITQLEEECDDGNQSNEDGCLDNCKYASCGDGNIWEGVEQCDDGNGINEDECTSFCTNPVCGDWIVQASNGEECDDGNLENGDSCSSECKITKVVFVSSSVHKGALGGLEGADLICQNLASAEGLSGTYKAWLSSDVISVKDRFTRANYPYIRADGVKVADNWTDLVTPKGDTLLQAPINVDESGMVWESGTVWTNTNTTAALNGATDSSTCQKWFFGGNDGMKFGYYGDITQTGLLWTNDDKSKSCDEEHHLYCFEQ